MVIAELLAAVESLDEDEQRELAAALVTLHDDDVIQVTENQRALIRSRHEDLRTDPALGLTRAETEARMRDLLA